MGAQVSEGRFRFGRRRFMALPVAGAMAATLGGVAHARTGRPEGNDGLDLILRGGTVVDGTGGERFTADVGIAGGFIAAVGDLAGASAGRVIDVSGLVVSPGFIDVHSHGSLAAIRGGAESSLRQGVTTEILHPDGGGILRIAERLSGDLETQGIGINVGAYIGFNAVWSNVIGSEDRRATEEEVRQCRRRVVSGLANGAWGLSAGLYYTPAYFAQTDQVIDISEAARPWRTNFPNHIRNENDEVIDATEETVVIGESTGVVPVITHMKVMGPANWGKSTETVGLIEDANARGVYAAADVYPYLRSQTGINATIPQWVRDGGTQAMYDRFNDPELRPQIEQEIEELLHSRVIGPEGVWIRSLGQTLAEVAATRWDDSPVSSGEAVMRVREEENANLSCIWDFGDEDDFQRILLNPTTAIASDGGASTSTTTHPRAYGTFPRVLGHYVREEGLLSLEKAIFKMTYLPATMIGMVDRGLLVPGMVADVTIFDPNSVIDRATFEEPRQLADGIEYVVLNGRLALSDGEPDGAVRAGRALRRAGSMISRPVTGTEPVRASVNGRLVPPERPEPDGDVFSTDFSDDEVGQPPAGWTEQWRDGDWQVLDGPRRLRMGSTAGRKALTWDAVGDVEDAELYGVVRGNGHETLFHLGVQTGGAAGSEDTVFLRARVEDASTPNQLQIGRYRDGSYFTQVSQVLPFPVHHDTWYRVLFRKDGDRFRGKMWPDGENEPQAWQVEFFSYETELIAGGSGGVGPGHCCSGAVTEWSFLSAGTGGERAPRMPGDPPPVSEDWGQVQVAFNARGAGAGTDGQLVLNDRNEGFTFRSTALGKLQVADGWASITGRGEVAGRGGDHAFLLILDQSDPLENDQTTVTVEIEGGYALRGVLAGGRSDVRLP